MGTQPRRVSSAHRSLRFGAESSTTSTRTGRTAGVAAEEGEGAAAGGRPDPGVAGWAAGGPAGNTAAAAAAVAVCAVGLGAADWGPSGPAVAESDALNFSRGG